MFDVAPTELLLVIFVAIVVIGPKDLPKAMRVVGYWVGRARSVAAQFRSGLDTMVREAELADLEKKWAEENARIMREHPPEAAKLAGPADEPAPPAAVLLPPHDGAVPAEPAGEGPLMVERPVVLPADPATQPGGGAPATADKATS